MCSTSRKPGETPADVLLPPPERREASTIIQWRAASDSLKRLNDALLRIGEAEAEAISRWNSVRTGQIESHDDKVARSGPTSPI